VLARKMFALPLMLVLLCACTTISKTTGSPTQGNPTMTISPQPALSSPTALRPAIIPPQPSTSDTASPPITTSTPAPIGLNPTGPYVIFFTGTGIWITNPDGSFPTKISDYELNRGLDMHKALSPQGDRLALVTSNEAGLDLVILDIPSGKTETITHLIDSVPPDEYDATSANSFATYAIQDFDSVAWQPGSGRFLAFIGATNGPTADLYLYDAQTGEITQLTDGPSQAFMPVWSPDGQYILHFGVSWVPPFGGAILGPNQLDGVWSVRASDGKIITLPKNNGFPHFIGWKDDTHYITYDSTDSVECPSENLRSVNVVSGEITSLMQASFDYYIAQSPENGNILFSSVEECDNSLGEGIFLLSPDQTNPRRLSDKETFDIEWMPESRLFYTYPEGLFSADGKIHYESPVYDNSYTPAVSKQGFQAWEAVENNKAHVVVRVLGGDWQAIDSLSADELIWDPTNGNTLIIAAKNGSLYIASYPDFAPHLMGNQGGWVFQVIWSP
jgi:hypothetical protein